MPPPLEKALSFCLPESPSTVLTITWQECGLDPATGLPTPFYQPDSIIIAISGAYKHQKFCYPGPRSGYAVFFGPGNRMNVNGEPVPNVKGQWMSFERGECKAAVVALSSVLQMLDNTGGFLPSGRKLHTVTVKTASEDVAKTVTDRYVYSTAVRADFSEIWSIYSSSRGH